MSAKTDTAATRFASDRAANPVYDALAVDAVPCQPSGHYARTVIGKRSSAWLIPTKSGQVRLILRRTEDVPAKLAEGVVPCDGTQHQIRVTSSNVKQGLALIKWAHGLLEAELKSIEADREAKRQARIEAKAAAKEGATA